MSYQEEVILVEEVIYIEKLKNAVRSYRGFTQTEKDYASQHLSSWVSRRGELERFINEFSDRFSLDIRPFLFEKKFMRRF